MLSEYPFWILLVLNLRTIVLSHSRKQREGGSKIAAHIQTSVQTGTRA